MTRRFVKQNTLLFLAIAVLFLLFFLVQLSGWKTLVSVPDKVAGSLLRDVSEPLRESFVAVLTLSSAIFALLFSLTLVIGYMNRTKYFEHHQSKRAMLSSLAGLAEFRDTETGRHLERTAKYAVLLARQMRQADKYKRGVTMEFVEDISEAAPLHDIGKVGIPDSILLKPDRLTKEEFEVIKEHTVIGRQVLQNTIDKFHLTESLFFIAVNLCAFHHEKYDGTGYPEGLRAEQIPLEARIFAVCDVYDALRTKRAYKDEMSHEEAVRIITKDSGSHFDPDVVRSFLQCEDAFQEIHDSYKFLVEACSIQQTNEADKNLELYWTKNLAVDVEQIDLQHQELFHRLNGLLHAIDEGKGKEEISRIIHFLTEYTIIHFSTEEAYMIESDYEGFHGHLAEHLAFIQNMNILAKDLTSGGATSHLVRQVERQAGYWLINHIDIMDKALGRHLSGKPDRKKEMQG